MPIDSPFDGMSGVGSPFGTSPAAILYGFDYSTAINSLNALGGGLM